MATAVTLTLCGILAFSPILALGDLVQTVSQLRVSAGSQDVGSWTARIGDIEMTLELRPGNKSHKDDTGTWTVKLRHSANSSATSKHSTSDSKISHSLPSYRRNEEVMILRAPVNDTSDVSHSQQVESGNLGNFHFNKLKDPSVPDEASQTFHLQENENGLFQESKAELSESQGLPQEESLVLKASRVGNGTFTEKVFNTPESIQAQRDRILRGIEKVDQESVLNVKVRGQMLKSHEVSDELQDEYNSEDGEEDGQESNEEVDSEAERIMNWYPRSRVLTKKNNGYKLFPGVGWFKMVTWPRRWSDARKECEKEGAHLAVPDSEQEAELFMDIFRRYPDVLELSILQNQVYIGVHDPQHNRNFTTVLGAPFQPRFSLWFPNEPDNAEPGEDCVTFHLEGKLRDVPCFYNLPYLCEKPIAPS